MAGAVLIYFMDNSFWLHSSIFILYLYGGNESRMRIWGVRTRRETRSEMTVSAGWIAVQEQGGVDEMRQETSMRR